MSPYKVVKCENEPSYKVDLYGLKDPSLNKKKRT